MTIKKFRRGETTYTCTSCKKNTRNTGGDEGACKLCLDCYNLAGIDNFLTDNGSIAFVETYGNEARATFKRRPELVSCFPDIAAALAEHDAPKLKYENVAKIGDRIRSYDFHGRTDCYVEGKVETITNSPFAAFVIVVDRDVWLNAEKTGERVGTSVTVPMEVAFEEYDGRIVKLAAKAELIQAASARWVEAYQEETRKFGKPHSNTLAESALAVLVLTTATANWLAANDPQALKQAQLALFANTSFENFIK